MAKLGLRCFQWFAHGPTYESTVTCTLDAGNRLTTTVDSITGTITRGFDGLDRLTSDATPQGTVTYTYDTAGRRASLTVPGQSVANYTFDAANRLRQIVQGTSTVGFAYDNANRRATLTLPNGIVTSYSYDAASQLTALTYTNGSATVGNLAYSYDNAVRRSQVGGSLAQTGLPNAVSITSYNANNQLTTWGTANLSYDLNGNMTSDGTHSYAWDARNRLSSMDLGNTASFNYDPYGRRVSKNIVGTATNFLYDGANAVQELSGTTPTANLLSGGIDEVFQRTDAAGARSFLTDALGSTLALTDSTGTTQTYYTFDPFGSTTSTGASSTNSFAYTGRELDATGLYFYRARYYNPALQRFVSEDPKSFLGGINLFAYALNDPILFSDPLGTDLIVTSYKGGADFAHIGIGVNSSQTSGFYPLDLSIPIGPGISINTHYTAPVWAPGIVLPDNGTVLDSVRIPTTPQQDQAVRDFLKNSANDPGSYSGLFGRTCGTFVSDALHAAKVPIDPSRFPKAVMQQLLSNPNYSNSGCQ
jgi:RHS repeat-associated protein